MKKIQPLPASFAAISLLSPILLINSANCLSGLTGLYKFGQTYSETGDLVLSATKAISYAGEAMVTSYAAYLGASIAMFVAPGLIWSVAAAVGAYVAADKIQENISPHVEKFAKNGANYINSGLNKAKSFVNNLIEERQNERAYTRYAVR